MPYTYFDRPKILCNISFNCRPYLLCSQFLFLFRLQQDLWEIDNNEVSKEKILKIARERYKGWRSTFSATYKAYDNYDERMKNKPQDLDIVEWHYLIMYFGSKKFKVICRIL